MKVCTRSDTRHGWVRRSVQMDMPFGYVGDGCVCTSCTSDMPLLAWGRGEHAHPKCLGSNADQFLLESFTPSVFPAAPPHARTPSTPPISRASTHALSEQLVDPTLINKSTTKVRTLSSAPAPLGLLRAPARRSKTSPPIRLCNMILSCVAHINAKKTSSSAPLAAWQ
jgi:hypothetical protein